MIFEIQKNIFLDCFEILQIFLRLLKSPWKMGQRFFRVIFPRDWPGYGVMTFFWLIFDGVMTFFLKNLRRGHDFFWRICNKVMTLLWKYTTGPWLYTEKYATESSLFFKVEKFIRQNQYPDEYKPHTKESRIVKNFLNVVWKSGIR